MIIGIEVEEHKISVILSSPRTVTAITGTVAGKEYSLAIEHPSSACICISTVRQIHGIFLARCIHKCDVVAVPSSATHIAREEPSAVRAPFKPQVAIAIRIVVLAVENSQYVLRLDIDDTQVATVFEECHHLAVWTVLRHLGCSHTVGQSLLSELCGIGKGFLVLVLD